MMSSKNFPGRFRGANAEGNHSNGVPQDFATAEGTLLGIAAQKQHESGQIARAMNQLADWQKKEGQEEAMRLTLTGLRDRFPGSGIELASAQRLARLDFSVDSNDRRDASELVSECLKQLEKHPWITKPVSSWRGYISNATVNRIWRGRN